MGDKYEGCCAELLTVSADATLKDVLDALLGCDSHVVGVAGDDGEISRYIDCKSLIRWLLKEDAERFRAWDVAKPIETSHKVEASADLDELLERLDRGEELPMFTGEGGRVRGGFSLHRLLAELASSRRSERERRLCVEQLVDSILEFLPYGVALASKDGDLVRANELARRIIKENSIGRSEIRAIIEGGYPGRVFAGMRENHYKVEANLLRDGSLALIAFIDVTAEYSLMRRQQEAQNELDTAFSVMLPDQRIEARLKSIVEYMDDYDEATGMIRITGVISQGCYRHVVNMLKLLADAFRQGLMNLPGMDKNTLVQAVILHDIGKVQPELKVGDVVDPKEVFEKGYIHAFRSASLGKALYGFSDDVYTLIKYHHHEEKDLPDEFPEYLLPMYRFFRMIDGLSAGITRRGSRVVMKIDSTRIRVREESTFPDYNREVEMDVYSGFFVSHPLK
ncbi:MAG: HD domain-containing protein [Thermacetogeniaceae bacterium]